MWYTASLLFEGKHEIEPLLPGFWEEQLILIEADNAEDARSEAVRIGRSKEHEYYVDEPSRHRVSWRFVQVERLYAVEEPTLSSGVELFSRFLQHSEVEALLTPFKSNASESRER